MKDFGRKYGVCIGAVGAYDSDEDMYHVTYGDGDQEDLDSSEFVEAW